MEHQRSFLDLNRLCSRSRCEYNYNHYAMLIKPLSSWRNHKFVDYLPFNIQSNLILFAREPSQVNLLCYWHIIIHGVNVSTRTTFSWDKLFNIKLIGTSCSRAPVAGLEVAGGTPRCSFTSPDSPGEVNEHLGVIRDRSLRRVAELSTTLRRAGRAGRAGRLPRVSGP